MFPDHFVRANSYIITYDKHKMNIPVRSSKYGKDNDNERNFFSIGSIISCVYS